MLTNYLKIAIRNLIRYKTFSFINIAGLTAGMTCCFLILLFVRHELQYDAFHKNADRIHRVIYTPLFTGTDMKYARIPPPVSPLLPQFFPEWRHLRGFINGVQASRSITAPGNPLNDVRMKRQGSSLPTQRSSRSLRSILRPAIRRSPFRSRLRCHHRVHCEEVLR
jgi:hypothetical protein